MQPLNKYKHTNKQLWTQNVKIKWLSVHNKAYDGLQINILQDAKFLPRFLRYNTPQSYNRQPQKMSLSDKMIIPINLLSPQTGFGKACVKFILWYLCETPCLTILPKADLVIIISKIQKWHNILCINLTVRKILTTKILKKKKSTYFLHLLFYLRKMFRFKLSDPGILQSEKNSNLSKQKDLEHRCHSLVYNLPLLTKTR